MNDSYKYASEVISDFMTEAGQRNTCGTVLVPMATGSGKTYAAADAAARLIADGDPHNSDRPSQIIYLTTRKAARNDYMDNLLAALSSRGYGREFTSRYVHLVEADADFVLSRIFTLAEAANGQVKISFNSDYLAPIKGFLENNWDAIDVRLVPSLDASKSIRTSVEIFEGQMLGLVANLNYLYSTNPVLREAGAEALKEAVLVYKRFGRSVKMAYDLTIQFHLRCSDLPAIKGMSDARELLKSLLYDPVSPWTWIPSLFPQVQYIDARVLVMTATKARYPIDTVLFGSINVLKDDEPRYIFIDEADAVKMELLDSCINDAVDNHQNIPRELMLLNERLDNRIDSANKDLFKTFKDNGVVDNGFLEKWQEFSKSLRGLVAGESLVYSLKRKEMLDREQSLFFASDVYGALSGASSTEHVITDVKNRVCWIVRPERSQTDGEKTTEQGGRRTNLWVLSQKCTRTYHRLAKLTYYNAREYQAYRKRKDFSRDLIRANELFASSEPTMATILSLVAELGLFDSESGSEEFAKYVYNLISTSTQSLNDEPFGIMSEEDCSIFHRGVDLMQLVDSEYHSTYTKVNTNSLKVTPEMIIAHLCNRSLVYLMSATIGIDHIGNFNLPYLDAASESGLIVPEGDYAHELDRIAGLRDLAAVDDYKIDVLLTDMAPTSIDVLDECKWHMLCDNMAFKRELKKLLRLYYSDDDNGIEGKGDTSKFLGLSRTYNILFSWRRFIERREVRSFICILMSGVIKFEEKPVLGVSKPDSKPYGYYIKRLMIAILADFGYDMPSAERFVDDTVACVLSDNLESEISKANRDLANGAQKFVITTYGTAAVALNLQYEIPDGVEVARVEGVYPSNKKDWDGIYLDRPTHMLECGECYRGEERLPEEEITRKKLKGVYETQELAEWGEISVKDTNTRMRSILKNNGKYPTVSVWDIPSARRACSRYVAQALGRIGRTGNKTACLIVLDAGLIPDVDVDAFKNDVVGFNYTTPEWKAVEDVIRGAQESAGSKMRAMKAKGWVDDVIRADKAGRRLLLTTIPKYTYHADDEAPFWSDRQIATYELLGRMCLSLPVGSKERYIELTNKTILSYLAPVPENGPRYYSQMKEGSRDAIAFFASPQPPMMKAGEFAREVSEERARLDIVRKNVVLTDGLERMGVATSWGDGDYMLSDELFYSIYLGRLGEKIFEVWWQNVMAPFGYELESLPRDFYELFDYRIKGTSVYIDAKDYSPNTKVSIEELTGRARWKLDRVEQDKDKQCQAVYVNAFGPSSGSWRRIDNKADVFEVPGVIDDVTGAFLLSSRDLFLGLLNY